MIVKAKAAVKSVRGL